ncbi:MAG: aspartate carbamoyltransferase [Patescibacteria group bacterium]|nr:aspartate carbamoyltransferase [Patescibacteria group bacterium]
MLNQDIISIDQFDRETLEGIFEVSLFLEKEIKGRGSLDLLKGKVMASLFFEPSTRTRFSFESAMEKLGGNLVSATGVNFSSMAKGETLEDTIKTIERYADVIVIRHPEMGSARIAADSSNIPVLNAGDGPGEHPTQALLDFYTIKKEMGKVEGLNIAMIGDLKHGRTIHSLLKLLSHYENINYYLVSPEELKIPSEYLKGIKSYKEIKTLVEVLPDADVLYMTRIQKERFASLKEYEKLKDCFVLNKKMLESAKKDMIIMHPLPRVSEIAVDVDEDPRAKYFGQVENGLYVRMALLALVLGKLKLKEKVVI